MFFSKTRILISPIISVIIVFLAMNFMSRNITILSQRSGSRIVIDYLINLGIFFIAIYIGWTIFVLIREKIFHKNPNSKVVR